MKQRNKIVGKPGASNACAKHTKHKAKPMALTVTGHKLHPSAVKPSG